MPKADVETSHASYVFRLSLTFLQTYTPARNYSEINSENIISCN